MSTNNSLNNYAAISSNGTLKRKRAQVKALFATRNFTIMEAFKEIQKIAPNETDRPVSTAIVTMVDKGILLEGITRPCSITGADATEYYLNPAKLSKKDTLWRVILRKDRRIRKQLQKLNVMKLKHAAMP